MSKALGRLIAAAEAYGDESVRSHRELYSWKRGDPKPAPFPHKVEWELTAAAKAYATSTRRKRTAAGAEPAAQPAVTDGKGDV